MTDSQRELVTMWENADASGKQLIFNVVECAVAFGDPFLKEMKELAEQGKKAEMNEALQRWMDIAIIENLT